MTSRNSRLIETTKEIIIAMISSSNNTHPSKIHAEAVAEAMDVIYNKLVQLSNNNI